MSGNVPSPAERLQAAADRIREVAAKATPGPWNTSGPDTIGQWGIYDSDWLVATVEAYDHNERLGTARGPAYIDADANAAHIAFWSPDKAELIARLLEGMAAHWATRPIADWNDYAITPLAALERHINGEEKP